MIRRCEDRDFKQIWTIINDGASAYRGIIPDNCWSEPYMSQKSLQHEIGVTKKTAFLPGSWAFKRCRT